MHWLPKLLSVEEENYLSILLNFDLRKFCVSSNIFVFWFLVDSYQKTKISGRKKTLGTNIFFYEIFFLFSKQLLFSFLCIGKQKIISELHRNSGASWLTHMLWIGLTSIVLTDWLGHEHKTRIFLAELKMLRFDLSNNAKKEHKYSFHAKICEIVGCLISKLNMPDWNGDRFMLSKLISLKIRYNTWD